MIGALDEEGKAYSPKNKTNVTEMITAAQLGTIFSKNIGNASMAAALVRSNVTRSK